ncbi:MAG: N-acetylmuramic acid 6-phosphate etherase [Armatimonadota bacterium]|nr:N-acetylmuramic acid 6-phosphate etherase [Armatimonadota bacterium]
MFEDLLTEQRNPRSMSLDQMTTLEILALINEEDAKVAPAVREALPQIAAAVELVIDRLQKGGRVFYVGAGTSGRIGLLDALEWPPTFGVDRDVAQAIVAGGEAAAIESASELEDDADLGAADLSARGVRPVDVVIGISASGRTPYVVGALRAARHIGAATVSLSCNPNGAMAELADVAITVLVGPEVLTGSTRMKAGTAQKMVLNMISTTAMVRLGKVYSNLMVDLQPLNRKLLERARRIVAEAAGISYEEAARFLEAAQNHVKAAIVMAVTRCDLPSALERLQRAGGFVRQAIESGKGQGGS